VRSWAGGAVVGVAMIGAATSLSSKAMLLSGVSLWDTPGMGRAQTGPAALPCPCR
jgi:hypothetical protein